MEMVKEEIILKYNVNKKERLLDADGKIINRDLQKAQIYSIYFCSVIGIK